MSFVTALLTIPLIIWATAWIMRGSVVFGCALYLVVASVLGPQFASFNVGVNLSLDRMLLPAIVLGFVAQNYFFGERRKNKLTVAEYWMLGFVGILVANTFLNDWRREAADQVPVLQHLAEGYLIPVLLYWIVKRSNLNERVTNGLLALFSLFGIYLALTALCEVFGLWQYVFPRYIADPDLGIHFGRARGPFLQSVRLGMYLLVGLAATWIPLVYRGCWGRAGRLLGLALTGLFVAAIFATYTRSIWMGLAVAGALLVAMTFVGLWRRVAVLAIAIGIVLGLAAGATNVLTFDRGIGAEATSESTSMRAVFAYVSWLMFQDAPFTGCGFGHFSHAKNTYLGDRATSLQLETIRGFIHHNTFLSILVELGVFGLLAIVGTFFLLGKEARRLWNDIHSEPWMREIALLFLLFAPAFAIQMLFHEVSYSPMEYGLLFFVAGAMANVSATRQATLSSTAGQAHWAWRPAWSRPATN